MYSYPIMRLLDWKFWFIQIPGWLLFAYLVYAQGVSGMDYELGVSMGTQESAGAISEVGVAFWYGFALGDLLVYIPLMLAALIGHMKRRSWGNILMSATLGITIYWPVVCLIAVVDARNAAGWNLSNEQQYWIVLPIIAAWALAGLVMMVVTGPETVREPE